MLDSNISRRRDSEGCLANLDIRLPDAPTPFGSYVEALQTGDLLFLSGMLPVINHKPAYVGLIGRELDVRAGQQAARTAALSALAAVRHHLGTLNRISRVIRLGIFMATVQDFVDHPAVADGASDLFRDVFGEGNMSVRTVVGVTSLPLGVPIELEATFELKG
jgi:enamine deaminase RidA (YjgF/YER057c/UK114 family)